MSVLTITHNRDRHLENVITGLLHQTVTPDEVIVVYMDQPQHPALPPGLPIQAIDIAGCDTLPLARARNAAASAASFDTLVFLDVDCIPAPDFVATITGDLPDVALTMGSPRYLSAAWQGEFAELMTSSEVHPTRRSLPLGPQDSYNTFWSLCFAIPADCFRSVGGFDERFVGYGAEDTDFAWTCCKNEVPYSISAATVFHQHHSGFKPPLNHFDDIVTNAIVFRDKWGTWPMEGWLHAFVDRGFLRWTPDSESLMVLRVPTAADIDAVRTDGALS